MPRPKVLVNQNQMIKNRNEFEIKNYTQSKLKTTQINKAKQDQLLRKRRSKEYIEAMHKLDAGGHVHNQKQVEEIINKISKEFPEIEIAGVLLGIISICYLGDPYEVHTLDMSGQIVKHYKRGQPLPNGMEKARGIALSDNYEFIEVYADCFRAITYDGSVAVIPQ